MNTKEKIEVMQAFEDGDIIQCVGICNEWPECRAEYSKGSRKEPGWDFIGYKYRVKPKEKVKFYKWAYKTHDNCWGESAWFYSVDHDVKDCLKELLGREVQETRRLDYTMIEVEK